MKKSSVGFLLVLLSIGLLAVLLMVRGLTKHIEALTGSLSKFSKGDLKVKSSVSTNDEIGIMSKVFNEMTDKITTLMSESVSKARMETELGTARSVQKKFIPAKDFRDDRVEINGYFEPASECGGDWWSYSIDGNSCWMMIGDVTGHGVASALMTAALKAGVSALTHIPDLKLSDFVEQLNKVICEAGQNQLMVTFFIARLDLDTGQLSYVNASHNPPIWMKTENSEMDFLMEIGGARLGQGHDSKYASTTVKLGERDLIFGFTDGLTEFENAEGREYGEKKVIKKIQKDFEAKTKLKEHRSSVLRDFKNFQKKTPLNDDLTYFFLQYKPGPANPWDLPPTQGPAA